MAFGKLHSHFTSIPLIFGFLLLISGCNGLSGENNSLTDLSSSARNAQVSQATIIPSGEALPSKNNELAGKTVDEILAQMSLREKIGQLFFIRAYGTYKSEDSKDYRRLVHQIKELNVGGVTFFDGKVYGQAVLTNKLQKAAEIPLWITQDTEWGVAMRVDRTTRLTPAMGIGATRNPHFAYLAGKVTAQEAKALGVNQIFAPVLDVNNNPRNPVINIRSFAGRPELVSKMGTHFIDGAASTGVVATGKHFPGHGDTDVDSHLALPVINKTYDELAQIELAPFKAAIESGLKSIMSAHIAFPEISKLPDRPSTLSKSVLGRILRDSLGFNGLVVTDAMEMAGIAAHYSPGKAVLLALKAGADVMLLSPDDLTAINYLVRAVDRGKITEERINKSVHKLLALKKEAGLFEDRSVNVARIGEVVSSEKHQRIADKIARASITLLKNEDNIIPLRAADYNRVLVLSISPGNNGELGSYLAERMRFYHPAVRFEVFDDRSDNREINEIEDDIRWSDLVIVASFININSNSSQQYNYRQRQLLSKLPSDKPTALITFSNPYAVANRPDAEVHLMAWQGSKVQMKAAADALFGASAIGGKLPIKIPGAYSFGEGMQLPKTTLRIDEPETANISSEELHRKIAGIMHQAIFDSTFPGGVVGVVKDGKLVYKEGFGYHTYEKTEPVNDNDVYDLASITKVVATTTAIMDLIDKGKISLNDSVSKYFEEFSEGKKQEVTIRHLLLHTSGLPPFRIYVDELKERSEIVEAVKNEPLVYETGTKYVYSDLGFILLGEIVDKVTGMPLNEYVRENFYYPLGMNSTFFNPEENAPWLVDDIPPAEIDTVYRHKIIQAEVHDERAWYMDGVAGHAGLFSSAGDLAIYVQMLLNGGTYGGKRYLSEAIIEKFTSRQSEFNNRGYGFDRKSLDGFSTAGSLSSKQTFGHLGFTGTSMWIDPTRDLAIIMLTNDRWPYRSYAEGIAQVRANIADAVISSIDPSSNFFPIPEKAPE